MTISELLHTIRQPYVDALAKAATDSEAHIEPAYRKADGSLATTDAMDLPCRADFIPKAGATAGSAGRVDAKTRLQFEPVVFELSTTSVSIHPFTWDWARVEVTGLPEDAANEVLRSWFIEWFDTDDRNEPSAQGLFNVVHFMSDPEGTELTRTATVDLGSAPAQALEDLLFRASDAGAVQVRVG